MNPRPLLAVACIAGVTIGTVLAEGAVGPADAAKRFDEKAAKRLFFTKKQSRSKFQANRKAVVTVAAPTFVPVEESTNNNGGASVCADFVASQPGAENRGDLNAKLGSFLAGVALPDGVKIRRLTMYANDFSDQDSHVLLVRKLLEDGLDPQFDGYEVIAQASTAGAENGVMRAFSDSSIEGDVVENDRYSYFLELVNCDAIEPFAVQVRHSRRG